MNDEMRRRIALLTRLVEKAPEKSLGRTAIMKLLYFLITLRRVPLGYYFTMYSYGPFDSTVLEDIDYAARLNALSVDIEVYPRGYGYVIQPGDAAESTKNLVSDFIQTHEADIDWVVSKFGDLSATDIELASTIVYVDQEWRQRGCGVSSQELVEHVSKIKPRFSREQIQQRYEDMRQRQLLTPVA